MIDQNMMRRSLPLSLAIIAAWLFVSPAAARTPADTIVFLGDSITAAGGYVRSINAALKKQDPDGAPRVIGRGRSSETVSGLSEAYHPGYRPCIFARLDKVLKESKPTWVVACYGINCGIYHPFSEKHFAAYKTGIEKLIRKVHASGARLVLLTPPPYARSGPELGKGIDTPTREKLLAKANAAAVMEADKNPRKYGYRTPYAYYDSVMARYSKWVETLAARDGVWVVNLRTEMIPRLKECYNRDPIHPNGTGHGIMAESFLKKWPQIRKEAGKSSPPATEAKSPRSIKGYWFYDPKTDDIPYNPKKNAHGPDYVFPDSPVAAWKKAADARIDKHRKSDLNITIVDKSGSPVSGVPVRVELKRHYFRFGAVLPLDFTDGPHSATYKKYFLKYFNSAGFAMGLKTSVCPEGDCTQGRNTRFYRAAEKDFKWLAKHNIEVRGHNLAWEGANYLHATQKAILNDAKLSGKEKGSRIFALMSAHFHHSIKKWDAFCWDVINEPRGNHVVNDLLADKNSFVEWFKLAGRLRTEYKRSGMKLYYNENRVVSWSKWGSYEANRDNYMGHIQDILNAGAPIDGIGFQYRFKMHVSPEIVYKRLCDFDKFKLPYQATEFELFKGKKQTVDFPTARKKQMTAELMTVFFSHPLADGLWHWTFADKAPGRGMKTMPRALFTYNGRPGPEAEQWIRMMEVDFNTDETTKTALDGSVKVRGFKGIYKVTIGLGAKARTAIVTLEEDQKLRLTY